MHPIRIVLIRHGEVEGINPPRFRGRRELPLTARGLRQAELTATYLAGDSEAPEALYCSPLGRCFETAALLGAPFGLTPIPLPELNDIDYGEWTGLAIEEVGARWPREAALWRQAPHALQVPGGESLQDVAARVANALSTFLSNKPRKAIAIVTHDSVIRVALSHALGLPLSAYWTLAPSPCGISTLSFTEGRFVVDAFNETQHLRNL